MSNWRQFDLFPHWNSHLEHLSLTLILIRSWDRDLYDHALICTKGCVLSSSKICQWIIWICPAYIVTRLWLSLKLIVKKHLQRWMLFVCDQKWCSWVSGLPLISLLVSFLAALFWTLTNCLFCDMNAVIFCFENWPKSFLVIFEKKLELYLLWFLISVLIFIQCIVWNVIFL